MAATHAVGAAAASQQERLAVAQIPHNIQRSSQSRGSIASRRSTRNTATMEWFVERRMYRVSWSGPTLPLDGSLMEFSAMRKASF